MNVRGFLSSRLVVLAFGLGAGGCMQQGLGLQPKALSSQLPRHWCDSVGPDRCVMPSRERRQSLAAE